MPSTLYDDLGVSSRATGEEIRDAHRRMAKLLHPDHCQDEITRKLAEAHMKRVNAAAAVLSDAEKRRQYDRELQSAPSGFQPRPRIPVWAWLAGVAFVAVVCLALTGGTPAPPVAKAIPDGPQVSPAPPPRRPLAKPAGASDRKLRKEAAVLSPAPRRDERPREFVPPPAAAETTPSFEAPPVLAPTPVALPAPRETVAGTWVYLKPSTEPAARNTYPPEYIEMVVVEDGARVKGRYSARYRVGNLAISPDVRFTFESGAWKGNGGSAGEIELKLLSPDRLQVSWVTTEPGPGLALGSGAAVLIRRRLP